MTTYYVDPAAAGSNNGTSWTNAWTSLQSAADTAVAGDVVYCRGNQTLGARIDFDTNGGTNAAGFIKFIGCNASGNIDGTRFLLNANGGSYHGLFLTNAVVMLWFENIEVYGTGTGSYDGFCFSTYDAAKHTVLINCCARNNGRHGFGVSGGDNSFAFRCAAYSNGGNGFALGVIWQVIFCSSRDNTGSGFSGAVNTLIGCIAHGNTDDGYSNSQSSLIFNCVIDGNSDDGYVATATTTAGYCPRLIGNRITNHSGAGDIGLNCNSEPVLSGFNYFENNADANIQNDTLHYIIPLEGGSSTSNLEDLSNTTSGGYVDPTNHDFSTNYVDAGDPDLRRTAITIPWS